MSRPCPHVPGFECPMLPGLECPTRGMMEPVDPAVAKAGFCRDEARRAGWHVREPNERQPQR